MFIPNIDESHCLQYTLKPHVYFFAACEDRNCTDSYCRRIRSRAVDLDTHRGIYGFIVSTRHLEREFLNNQHLFVLHILLYEKANRSKFLVRFACPKDLSRQVNLTIASAIRKKTVRSKHKNGHIYTSYLATFSDPIGTFVDLSGSTRNQFRMVVVFRLVSCQKSSLDNLYESSISRVLEMFFCHVFLFACTL